MILLASVGGRWTASSTPTSRPSRATSTSPCRSTWTGLPSSRMRRYSVTMLSSGRSAGCGQVGAAHLTDVVGVLGRTPGAGEAAIGTVEPQVHLAGADRVLVRAV